MSDRQGDFWATFEEMQRRTESIRSQRTGNNEGSSDMFSLGQQRKVVDRQLTSGNRQSEERSWDQNGTIINSFMDEDVRLHNFAGAQQNPRIGQSYRFGENSQNIGFSLDGISDRMGIQRRLLTSESEDIRPRAAIGDEKPIVRNVSMRELNDLGRGNQSNLFESNRMVNLNETRFSGEPHATMLDRDSNRGNSQGVGLVSGNQADPGRQNRLADELKNLIVSNSEIRKAFLELYQGGETQSNPQKEVPKSLSGSHTAVDIPKTKVKTERKEPLYERREEGTSRGRKSEEKSPPKPKRRSVDRSRRSRSPRSKRSRSPRRRSRSRSRSRDRRGRGDNSSRNSVNRRQVSPKERRRSRESSEAKHNRHDTKERDQTIEKRVDLKRKADAVIDAPKVNVANSPNWGIRPEVQSVPLPNYGFGSRPQQPHFEMPPRMIPNPNDFACKPWIPTPSQPYGWNSPWPRPLVHVNFTPRLPLADVWSDMPLNPNRLPVDDGYWEFERKMVAQRPSPKVLVNVPLISKSLPMRIPTKDKPALELPKLMKKSFAQSSGNKSSSVKGQRAAETTNKASETQKTAKLNPVPVKQVPMKNRGQRRAARKDKDIKLNLLKKDSIKSQTTTNSSKFAPPTKVHRKSVRQRLKKRFIFGSCMYCGIKHIGNLEPLTDALCHISGVPEQSIISKVSQVKESSLDKQENVNRKSEEIVIAEKTALSKEGVEVVNISDDELETRLEGNAGSKNKDGDGKVTVKERSPPKISEASEDGNTKSQTKSNTKEANKLEAISSDEEDMADFDFQAVSDSEFVVLEELDDSDGIVIEEISSDDEINEKLAPKSASKDEALELDVIPSVEEPESPVREIDLSDDGFVAEEQQEAIDNLEESNSEMCKVKIIEIKEQRVEKDTVPEKVDPHQNSASEVILVEDNKKENNDDRTCEENGKESAQEAVKKQSEVIEEIETVDVSEEKIAGEPEEHEDKSAIEIDESELHEDAFVIDELNESDEDAEGEREEMVIDDADDEKAKDDPINIAEESSADVVLLDSNAVVDEEDENSEAAVEDVYISDDAMEELEEMNNQIVDLEDEPEDKIADVDGDEMGNANSDKDDITEIIEVKGDDVSVSHDAKCADENSVENDQPEEVSVIEKENEKESPVEEVENAIVETKEDSDSKDQETSESQSGCDSAVEALEASSQIEDTSGKVPQEIPFILSSDSNSTSSESQQITVTLSASLSTLASDLALDHFAAGSLETAFKLLNEQIGVINFVPFKSIWMVGNYEVLALKASAEMPSQNFKCKKTSIVGLTMEETVKRLQVCYQATTTGSSEKAISLFRDVLQSVPMMCVEKKRGLLKAKMLINICRNYITSLSLEVKKKSLDKSSFESEKRACELAAYETNCKLQSVHQVLTLRIAQSMFFKIGNYKTAAAFARQILEAKPPAEVVEKTTKMLAVCEKNMTDTVPLAYDCGKPFVICVETLTPIYNGEPEVKCPFCQASYVPSCKGILCRICSLSEVGRSGTGLKLVMEEQ